MLAGPLPELVDHQKLAHQAAVLEGAVPVEQFTRFCELLADSKGEVRLKLEFSTKDKRTRVRGQAEVEVNLVCQNCLLTFPKTLECLLDLSIVEDSELLENIDQSEDVFVCAEETVRIVDLVEDELILSVPMVPRHDAGTCPNEERTDGSDASGELTHRPFADLGDQLAAMEEKQNKVEN